MLIVKSTRKAAVRNLVEIFLHAPHRENNRLCSARAQPHKRARKNTPMDAEKGEGPLLAYSTAGSSVQANGISATLAEVWTESFRLTFLRSLLAFAVRWGYPMGAH